MAWCDDTSPTVASEHETLERKVYNSYEHIAFTKLIAEICESRDIALKKKKKKSPVGQGAWGLEVKAMCCL